MTTPGRPPAPAFIHTPDSWTARLDLPALYPSAQPLEVDLGCGKGRFLLARAAKCPDRNILGVDRLLVRLRKIDRKLARAGLRNVRLLRIENAYAVTHLLPPGSVSVFYIFFPDPWPKRRHHRRRLFTPAFLDSLHQALIPGGIVHAATDHADYGQWIRDRFAADARFTAVPPYVPPEDERTDFECLFLGQGLSIARCSYATAYADARVAPPAMPISNP